MRSIEVKNISYTYPDGVEVFKNISFDVNLNESIGIIGPNGAGKTTLLLALSGLVSNSGEIFVGGVLKSEKNITEIRKKISFVFQNPDDQLFMPHVEDDIAFGLDKLGFSAEEIRSIVKDSLRSAGLEGFELRSSHHLSLGQKKRVCLAAAFARTPEILLLDEPSNELDPGGRRELIRLIKKFTGTKLVVSHDLDMIAEVCDKVLILNSNSIVASGNSKKILSDKELMENNSLEIPFKYRR
ncbi:MAG: energy-coupling factor ABC transporter ATP-binding protein [Acidobacteriota bacterium]